MSTASKGITRKPLQENLTSTNTGYPHDAGGMKDNMAETPVSRRNQRFNTPPESVLMSRKKSEIIDTPITRYGADGMKMGDADLNNTRSALLSPAFSSPQQSSSGRKSHLEMESPPKPNFIKSLSSISESDEDKTRGARGRSKKSRKELRKAAFDFNSDEKPPYSYATLIGMSILSNSDKRLTLSQIYLWISDTFKYYRRDEMGWQNSIRHNLSLNKAFVKGEKSKDGKGHFWCIQEGCEDQFLRSKNSKKHSYQEILDQIAMNNSSKKLASSIPSSPNVANEESKYGTQGDEVDGGYATNEDSFEEEDDSDSVFISQNKRRKISNNHGDNNHDNRNYFSRFDNLDMTPHEYKLSRSPACTPPSRAPKFVISETTDRPVIASRNLNFTSSFSCNSNLELSPLRPSETGPLLEPLTPANNAYRNDSAQNNLASSTYHTHTFNNPPSLLPASHSQLHVMHAIRTPKTNVRTPFKNFKTPQTASIMKKIWNSPSYLEEFYYSPLLTSQAVLSSYDDDDMILRAFESPAIGTSQKKHSMQCIASSRNLLNDLKHVETKSGTTNSNTSNEKESLAAELGALNKDHP